LKFIKTSKLKAKSYRITFNHSDSKMKFTLYPMVHLASMHFYEGVSKDLNRFDYILYEGVTWRKDGKGKTIYDWAAKNLGLVTQRKFLKFPDSIAKINIDMPAPEFRERFLNLSIIYRILFRMLRPWLWFITKFPVAKKYIISSMTTKEAKRYSKSHTDMDELILTDRDEHICEEIRGFTDKHFSKLDKTYTAVLFGANHMVSISHCLRELGFKPKTKKWFDLIRPTDIGK